MLKRKELLGINYNDLSTEELEIKLNKEVIDWMEYKKKAIKTKKKNYWNHTQQR